MKGLVLQFMCNWFWFLTLMIFNVLAGVEVRSSWRLMGVTRPSPFGDVSWQWLPGENAAKPILKFLQKVVNGLLISIPKLNAQRDIGKSVRHSINDDKTTRN